MLPKKRKGYFFMLTYSRDFLKLTEFRLLILCARRGKKLFSIENNFRQKSKRMSNLFFAFLAFTFWLVEAQAQNPNDCNSQSSIERQAAVQLSKVMEVKGLLIQLRDNAQYDVLCKSPEELEQKLGIPFLWGDWRFHKNHHPRHYVWPKDENEKKARLINSPIENYKIEYIRVAKDWFPSIANPGYLGIKISASNLCSSCELIALNDLIELFGIPIKKEIFFGVRDGRQPSSGALIFEEEFLWLGPNTAFSLSALINQAGSVRAIDFTTR